MCVLPIIGRQMLDGALHTDKRRSVDVALRSQPIGVGQLWRIVVRAAMMAWSSVSFLAIEPLQRCLSYHR
jgi:hypothetical protein